ncbi:uncharacterized protein PGTG_16519 [Puccinia graminis f. sp. tritici CRL 75-36-700-3]|uniref:Uncharacterized protein n=1 Tax=Puccinia graminis f. sp. tritici (strain CRL 75-36-700-3 / race SCCL) TaxID=418459 RepID=E3L116_PUCGT|nr:uncharacterized protein PGTG_16519 [Puccinia graminis f. sp. tritici CRL 75-36-700-3]EFP90241.2 hypothetical protein PGTG_16519 [Puccinia graminis f. sp. tritici CRL 75-36-700-3]
MASGAGSQRSHPSRFDKPAELLQIFGWHRFGVSQAERALHGIRVQTSRYFCELLISLYLLYAPGLNPQVVWRKDHQGQYLGTFSNHVRTPFELLEVKHVIKLYRSPRSPRPKDSQFPKDLTMRTRQLPDLLSFLDEYPLTKKYSKREIGPLVLVVSTLILTGLCIFNVFTQGKAEKIESFLSTRFLDNSTNGKGDHVTCQPTLLKVDDNFFMVIPPDENETLTASVEDLQIAAHSNMSFKWTLVDIGDESGTGSRKVSTGFLYRGERTNCSVNFVKSTYQFQDTNYQYIVCGTCLIGTKLKAKLCNSLNAAADDLLRGSSGRFWTSSAHVYRSFDGYDPRLSIPLHTLPLSAFPPNYTEVQEDYYRSFKPTIGPRDITELGTWLGGVKLIPASQLSGYDVEFPWRTLPPPQGNIFVDNSTEPSDFFSAFNTTYHALCQGHECSNFRITVNGIGALGPFGFKDTKLFKIPEVLMDMFNRSLSYDVRIMDLAANDLHGKEIGATYLCTKTTKKWLPLLKVISVTLGSSSGLFSGIFSYVIVAVSFFSAVTLQVKQLFLQLRSQQANL